MKFQDICTKKTYTDKNGNEKAKWSNVGVLKTADNGKQFIELGMFPNTDFYVFDKKEKNVNNDPF